MRWKEMITGALITLVVTVIGGLLVYYFTQQKEEKNEHLWFQTGSQVAFDGNENSVAIGVLKFGNIGGKAAQNVTAVVNTGYAKLLEYKVTSESNANVVSEQISDNKLKLTIGTLLSDETISLTYLLDNSVDIDFTLRSNSSMGEAGYPYSKLRDEQSAWLNILKATISLSSVFGSLVLLLLLRGYIKEFTTGLGKNNVGFVLLHSGVYDQAARIFLDSIKNGRDTELAYSNYAAALALQGNVDEAPKYIRAGEYIAQTSHTKAVLEMNKAIVSYHKGDFDRAKEQLEKAVALSKKRIKNYIAKSIIFDEMGESVALTDYLATLKPSS